MIMIVCGARLQVHPSVARVTPPGQKSVSRASTTRVVADKSAEVRPWTHQDVSDMNISTAQCYS